MDRDQTETSGAREAGGRGRGRRVAVVGASPRPDRYSHQACRELQSRGFTVIPVTPSHPEVAGMPTVASPAAVETPIDTVCMYLSPVRSAAMGPDLAALRPVRVIMSPGSENPALERELGDRGVTVEHGCPLVMLRTGVF